MVYSCSDWVVWLVPFSSPFLAFLYQVSVLSFNAAWHDCHWDSMTIPILFRAGLVVASISCSIAICQAEGGQTSLFSSCVLLGTLAGYAIYMTRLYHVQGGRPPKQVSMEGKVVMVTGANTGIGKETACQLVQMGATVILACRSEQKARQAMEDIQASVSHKTEESPLKGSGRMIFLPLDFSDLASVRACVDSFRELKLPLHVLINNAGLMMGTQKLSKDGYEMTMQCNHLGPFLLTILLLDNLKGGRVVNVTSSTYILAKDGMDFDDLFCQTTRPYSLFGQYAQSKLANILFTNELARRQTQEGREDPITTVAVHPGLVRTDVVRNMPWYLKYPNIAFGFAMATLQKTPAAGAYTSVHCATTLDPLPNGTYWVNCKPVDAENIAKNEKDAAKLWTMSENLVGVKTFEK